MSTDGKPSFDETDTRILAELQQDARVSMAELGRRVALSAPAVADRVRRLEDAGVIEGYSARVNPRKLGYGMQAIITLAGHPDATGIDNRLADSLERMPEVRAVFFVTGPDGVFVRVAVRDTEHLQQVIDRLNGYGRTATWVILSTPVKERPLLPPDSLAPG